MAPPLLRLGSRASPLARAQATELANRLAAAHAELAAPGAIETVLIRTSGDKVTDRTLADAGGKGLFTKELEEALLAKTIDLAVHSMKDMPTLLPPGLVIACHLPREDPRDVFISSKATRPAELPQNAVIGTASLRRAAQLLHWRRDLRMQPLRGNIETRIAKLEAGEADAIVLALAGLKRLGLAQRATAVLGMSEMLPAVAQGAIGVECRGDDERVRRYLAPLDDPHTMHCITAERAFLAALDGSCRTPIAALATIAVGTLHLRGMIIKPDGSTRHVVERRGAMKDAARIGADAGAGLKARAGPGFLDLKLDAEARP